MSWHTLLQVDEVGVRRIVKHTAILLFTSVLVACSSKEKLVLPEVENTISPKKVWSSSIGDGVAHYESSLKPLIVGDTVYAASREGLVSAYELSNGKRKWTFDLRRGGLTSLWGNLSNWWSEENARISGGVGFGYGKLFLGTEDGEVFALSPETGELEWRVEVKAEVLATPVAGDGLVIVATGAGTIVALHPDTGEQRWIFENEQPPLTLRGVSEPVIEAGGVVYATSAGRIGVLISERGYQAWEEQIASPKGSTDLSRLVDIDARPIVAGGNVYSMAYNGELVALELRTGRQLWKREYASFRNMAIAGNTLYIVDSVGRIYAVDRRNGTELWSQFGLHRHYLTGPTVYKDYLVVGDNKGHLHWLDRSSGEFVARQNMDSSGFYTEAVATADYLLVQSRDGSLVLLQTP